MGRSKGTGCVGRRRTRRGLYRGYWTDERGQRHWLAATTRAELERRVVTALTDHRNGARVEASKTPTPTSTETVGEFLGRWLTETEGTTGRSTWVRYEEVLRIHAIPEIGHLSVRSNLIPALKRMQLAVITPKADGGHGVKHGTLDQVRAALHKAFEDARRDGTIDRAFNPMDAVDDLVDRSPKEEPAAVSDETVQHILSVARTVQPRWFPLYALLAVTGMDLGTALALRRSDIDLAKGQLRVVKSVRRIRGATETTQAKREQRHRPVYLDDALLFILADHLDALDAEAAAAAAQGKPWPPETADLVFPRADGGQQLGTSITNHYWQKVLSAASLPARAVRLKDFRATVVTVLFEEEYEEAVIQKIVGHAVGTKITRRHYFTAREAVHRRAMTAVRSRLLPDNPQPGANAATSVEHATATVVAREPAALPAGPRLSREAQ